MLFRGLIYAIFRRLFPASPEHPASPPHQTANQQILTSAPVCRQRSHALPLPDAKFARTNPGPSRTVDGEREGNLAGPDEFPPLRRGPTTGRDGRPRPLPGDLRRPVLEPALPRLRNRLHHTLAYRLRGGGHPRGRIEREERGH